MRFCALNFDSYWDLNTYSKSNFFFFWVFTRMKMHCASCFLKSVLNGFWSIILSLHIPVHINFTLFGWTYTFLLHLFHGECIPTIKLSNFQRITRVLFDFDYYHSLISTFGSRGSQTVNFRAEHLHIFFAYKLLKGADINFM